MEKILVIGCKQLMNDVCIGCSPCMVGFNRKEGEFSRYKDYEVQMVGLLSCGGCPGSAIIHRMSYASLWYKSMGEMVTKIHIASCIMNNCPYKGNHIKKITSKSGIDIIEGTHPYTKDKLFSSS